MDSTALLMGTEFNIRVYTGRQKKNKNKWELLNSTQGRLILNPAHCVCSPWKTPNRLMNGGIKFSSQTVGQTVFWDVPQWNVHKMGVWEREQQIAWAIALRDKITLWKAGQQVHATGKLTGGASAVSELSKNPQPPLENRKFASVHLILLLSLKCHYLKARWGAERPVMVHR